MNGLLVMLTFGTLGFVMAFGYIGARMAEKRRVSDENRSSLCATSPHWKKAAETTEIRV